MNIADNLQQVLNELPEGVRLVAVSKFHPNEAIEEAYRSGQRVFGESKVQEMTAKYESLPKDIEWHFIGHLQTNKIKYIVPYVALIHGIDSYKLLVEVNKQAEKAGKVVNCLLQLHIAEEETKFGFSFDECRDMLAEGEWKTLSNIQLCGLMGMATNTDDNEQIEKEFCSLSSFFKEVKDSWFADTEAFRELSMGMSHDYHQAIAAGSTLIRVGSKSLETERINHYSLNIITMATLKTTFAGLELRNPIIVSSSGLTDSAEKNQKFYEAGVGAIVLKSLFEEQIMMEADWLGDPNMYPEGSDYLVEYVRQHKLSEYLELIKETKKVCPIPVIASINCYQDAEWVGFAQQMEAAGADAIEINILALQTGVQYNYGSFEQRHIDILSHIKKTVRIPIIMKLGDNLTNPIALIDQLYANGAAAVVLFNRFYQPDIDIEKMKQISGNVFSTGADLVKSLRWIGIASAAVSKLDYAASGGIHSPEGIVKAILAGASAVEICSAFYQNSYALVAEYTRFLNLWMDRKGMETISQFKGMLNVSDLNGVNTFERTQFMKYFSSRK